MARFADPTDKQIHDIASAVSAGNYMEVAAGYANVNKRTFLRWCSIGQKDIEAGHETKCAELVERVDVALARCESMHVAYIAAAAEKHWTAAAWWLERRFPNRWGQFKERLYTEDSPTKGALLEFWDGVRARYAQLVESRKGKAGGNGSKP